MKLLLKRAYDAPDFSDGQRILVDRMWPRGISKENANIDLWLKEVAPSNELRKWFNHEVEKWPEFEQRFRAELADNAAVQSLKALAKKGTTTLLFAAKDTEHNNAVVLKKILEGK
ncbi:MAG: hypothetical protein RL217_505 [Pseudomonadota bacterium]